MNKMNKILIALDLTLIDQNLIKCANMLQQYYTPQKVYFIHVVSSQMESQESMPEMKMLSRNQMQVIEEELHEEIQEHFSPDINYRLLLKTGSAFSGILEAAITEDVDLIVMGKKKELKGSGIVPLEVSRFAPTSLMLVPEKHKCQIQEVVVCNDFSKFSRAAMQQALQLAKKQPEAISITSLHLFHGDNNGTDHSDKKDQLIRKYNDFIKDLDLGEMHVTPNFIPDRGGHYLSEIKKFTKRKKASMIITGSRGTSQNNMFMTGSLTERMIRGELPATLLVVKPHIKRRVASRN